MARGSLRPADSMQLLLVDGSILEGDFFHTGDLDALAVMDVRTNSPASKKLS